ncbi:MAG: biliverdin-producing heme oxygenase [Ketobacteraceae bacterium]|nr:biliverdin-producing heme oxygenase [Ketobacteraceae bacterium]
MNILSQLKSATQPYHNELECRGIFSRLLSSQLSQEEYRAALLVLLGLHQNAEPAIIRFLAPDFLSAAGFESFIPFIYQDLGIRYSEPADASELGFANAGESLGALYVVMGSALGSREIIRHLRQHRGLRDAGERFAYYTALSEKADSWKSFMAGFEGEFVRTGADADAVIRGAIAAFRYLTEQRPTEVS